MSVKQLQNRLDKLSTRIKDQQSKLTDLRDQQKQLKGQLANAKANAKANKTAKAKQ